MSVVVEVALLVLLHIVECHGCKVVVVVVVVVVVLVLVVAVVVVVVVVATSTSLLSNTITLLLPAFTLSFLLLHTL